MKNKYIKSVLFICASLLFCACEQQVDDIVNNVQRISGPSCCTTSHNVSWDGTLVNLYQNGSTISFVSKVSGTLSFYYETQRYENCLQVKQNGHIVYYNPKHSDRAKVVIHNVQAGDKFRFVNKDDDGYYHIDHYDIWVDNIIITAGNGNNSNNSDNPDWDF